MRSARLAEAAHDGVEKEAHVDAPELLDGVECHNLLEQIVPVVALQIAVNSPASEMSFSQRSIPSH